ncbi:hypothetical protein [Anaerotardibacter muris]|uniref:hypothetical protein n=1 Tax=Anaerotardibacter muris TaxID=2941505 RepID=UPI00203EFBB5|nr:hypothetical protein [Anaerotardibacter muris]
MIIDGIEISDPELELDRNIVRALVQNLADTNDSISYGELATLASSYGIEVHYRQLDIHLEHIQRFCRECKLPTLATMAVNAESRIPGPGYYGLYRELYPDTIEFSNEDIVASSQKACKDCTDWQKLYNFLEIPESAPSK